MSFNKVILVGNLGRDPELRYTPQGTPVCSFSMATNERRKDKTGEMQDQTTWFRVTLWGRQAETASQYLTKGRPVYIEGRLRVEEWTDRDGKPRHTWRLTRPTCSSSVAAEEKANHRWRGQPQQPAAHLRLSRTWQRTTSRSSRSNHYPIFALGSSGFR